MTGRLDQIATTPLLDREGCLMDRSGAMTAAYFAVDRPDSQTKTHAANQHVILGVCEADSAYCSSRCDPLILVSPVVVCSAHLQPSLATNFSN